MFLCAGVMRWGRPPALSLHVLVETLEPLLLRFAFGGPPFLLDITEVSLRLHFKESVVVHPSTLLPISQIGLTQPLVGKTSTQA